MRWNLTAIWLANDPESIYDYKYMEYKVKVNNLAWCITARAMQLQHYDRFRVLIVPGSPLLRGATTGRFKSVRRLEERCMLMLVIGYGGRYSLGG